MCRDHDRRRHGSRGVAALLAVGLGVAASPARGSHVRNLPTVVVQPDGTRLQLFVTGDEFHHRVHDADGRTVLRDETTGVATWAEKVDGRLIAGLAVVGVDDPVALGIEPGLLPDPGAFPDEPEVDQALRAGRRAALAPAGPAFSRIESLVVFVRFAGETEFSESRPISDFADGTFNGPSSAPTVKSYYLEASYGQLTVESNFLPAPGPDGRVVSYQDAYPRRYYQAYAATNPEGYRDAAERRARESVLVAAAAGHVAAQVPSGLDLDTNGDGEVDGLVFVVHGEPDVWGTLLWPHKGVLTSPSASLGGKRVGAYNLQLEAQLSVGVLCHELFHTLGAPDLYHYDTCGAAPPDVGPVASWDLMAAAREPPQHMGAYMKWRYGGWLASIPLITRSGTYTLSPLTASTGNAYRIASPYSLDESYVVEYRRKSGLFESSLPSEGLLVTRIDSGLDGVGNACGPPDEVYVYRPGGSPSEAGEIEAAPLSIASGRTAIDETTDPVPFLRDGMSGGLAIRQVGEAGETISFHVEVPAGPCTGPLVVTSPADGSAVAGSVATLSWTPAEGATGYDVSFGTTSDFSVPSSVTGTSTTRPVTAGQRYYWRVAARGAGDCRRSSALATFVATAVTRLSRDVAVNAASAVRSSWTYYSVDVPPGATDLRVTASGGTGSAALAARFGYLPSTDVNDCVSNRPGAVKECVFPSPWAGTLYLGLFASTPYEGVSLSATWSGGNLTTTTLFVPVVLKAPGKSASFFTSELTLTNRGDTPVDVRLEYVATSGTGPETATVSLAPRSQLVVPDAIEHLRTLGVPIPRDGSQVGTLRVSFSGLASAEDAGVTVRTTTPVPPLAPIGAAGLAYAGVPLDRLPAGPVVLCGLRSDGVDRSNVAIQNAGGSLDGDVTLRVSLFSGGSGSEGSLVASEEKTLGPGGFHQLAVPAGFLGWALVERTGGSAPFYAYGVINDEGSSDGSFLAPAPAASAGAPSLMLPVVVEAAGFSTELVVTNLSAQARRLVLSLFADPIPGGEASFELEVPAGRQVSVPEVVAALRLGAGDLPTGIVGPLLVRVDGGTTAGLFVGARTGISGPGGRTALFYEAVPAGAAAALEARVDALQQTETTRSNLALVNSGEVDSGESTFLVEVWDGATGRKAGERTVSVAARRQLQINGVLAELAPGTRTGYARVTRTKGANPFVAYGVVNDGATPGERSGDGSWVTGR